MRLLLPPNLTVFPQTRRWNNAMKQVSWGSLRRWLCSLISPTDWLVCRRVDFGVGDVGRDRPWPSFSCRHSIFDQAFPGDESRGDSDDEWRSAETLRATLAARRTSPQDWLLGPWGLSAALPSPHLLPKPLGKWLYFQSTLRLSQEHIFVIIISFIQELTKRNFENEYGTRQLINVFKKQSI